MPTPHRPLAGATRARGGGSSSLTSCLLATTFLLILAAAAAAAVLILFRPQNPTIHVSAIQLPSFSSSNRTLTFTFSQFSAVRNPNRASFSHSASELLLLFHSRQIAHLFIPAAEIDPGRTQYMAATFSVPALSLPNPSPEITTVPGAGGSVVAVVGGGGEPDAVEVESRLTIKGRVRVLSIFTHRVEVSVACRVAVAADSGAVLGFRC